jgi:drug/metabolite transporter (DMT)-like permease
VPPPVTHGLLALVSSWQLYVVLLLGTAGQYLTQRAFQSGPITSSLPAISTVDPLLSVLIGVLVYHEVLHRGPFGGLLLLVLLLLLVAAVIQLGRVETEKSTSTAASPSSEKPDALEIPDSGAGRRAAPETE